MSSTRKITLKSSDGESFEVDEAVALESQTIKHMIEDNCANSGIPLPNVTSKILAKVIEYCKKHVEAAASEDELKACIQVGRTTELDRFQLQFYQSRDAILAVSTSHGVMALNRSIERHLEAMASRLKAWDAEFAKVDPATLFDLILAANYLNIKSLLDLTCLAVADLIKGMTPGEIKKTFNIKDDFTPEEEEEVRRENQWAFE